MAKIENDLKSSSLPTNDEDKEINELTYSYFQLFRYSTLWEKVLILAGIGCAVISASGVVIINIMYGEITTLFIDRTVRNGTSKRIYILNLFGGGKYLANATDQEYKDALIDDAASYGLANLANFVIYFATAALSVQLMNWTAVRQITRIRLLFLKSVIRQDMSWFDTETNLNFASRVTDDMEKLKEGISEKVAIFVNMSGAVVICCCTALGIGWELALVGLTVVAASIGAAAVVLRVQAKSTVKELKAYSHAGRVVEEVLSGVRTVVAFNGEEKEIERYAKRLSPAEECARRRGAISSAGDGIKWFLTYILNAIIFYYGTQLIIRDGALPEDERIYNPGNMVTILFCLFFSAQNIALCSTHTDTFSVAKGAAKTIFELLDRRSEIDCLSHEGAKPRSLVGSISLENVFFNYPARPDVKVLQGLTLAITPGETVALVGPSGCGKSTILQLIQRLYDPASGSVSIDEQAVKNLNLGWLRTRLGVVGQEPVLFSGTIRDNIALGKDNATFEEIKEAAKKASAHDFILHMADGYCTVIGERGAQLSGGQKQRIAIARSLIRNPKILLLDEATSALDLRSERKVQAALDKASEGRTTLVVSHRLSTVVNATRIVYIDNGIVAEQGTHQELLNKRGLYWKLVQTDRENHPEYGLQAALKEEDGVDEDADEDLVLKTARAKDNGLTEVPSAFLSQRLIHRKSSTFSMKSVTKILTSHAVNENSKLNDTEDVESSTWSLLKLNAKEWPYILVGCVASCLVGCTQPLFAILFSELNEMFSYGNNEDILAASKLYSGLFALVAAMSGVTTFVQAHLFTVAGLKMTTRLRIQTFRSYLKQEMGWFDNPRNSVGALCARLSTDAAAIQGATGMRVGIVLQCVATMLIGIVLAMIYSWKVTLVSIVIIPLVIITMFLEGYITRESHLTERKAMEDASQIATEAIMNIRTIQSLGIAPKVIERYMAALEQASKAGNMKTRLRGCVYAMGLTSTPMAYALVFYYGGVLIATEDMPYKTPILVSMLLLYGAYTMGQVLCLAPNFNSAKISGSRIIRLMERQPRITSAQGLKDTGRWTAKGDISYSNVEFRYPTRPGIQVLQGLDLELEAGKTLALVGHSGCGKSTCIQLLQRLYDMDGGHVTIDAKNIIKDLTLPRLRSQLGIVQQEPVLFDKTIAENIKYGDNSRTVQMEEVQAASIAANVHGFITALPMGYETTVGSMGTQLSGGQKQRVAIARALVRNPRILLLDEATSALDTQSEKLVQQALDVAKESRTCIIIAHRLATVHNADKICVLDKGKVAEHGTHAELMQLGGLYYELNQIQSNTN